MRDITLGNTIYIKFTTRAFSTGVPTTLAGTPVLSIYEENNLTQITAGVSVTIDYDSVTGLNQATIVATSGNGYESGKSYDLVITTGTVGGVSVVGEVVGSFTVESEAAFSRIGLNGVGLSNIGTIATVTNLTNLPTIPANWLTASGIAASALNGKGDWNIGKTGYSISGTLQTLDALNNFDPANDIVANVTLVATTTANSDMRGTDGANTTAPDNASIAAILVDTGTTIPAQISGLNDVAATEIVSNGAITTLAGAIVNVDLVDTCTVNSDMRGTDGANTTVPDNTSIAAILIDTNEIQGDWTNGGRLDLLLDQLITQIDTSASEPAQGAPPVSAKMALKIDYLYKWSRNRSTSTSTTINMYADDATTVDHKMTHSDDGTTYDQGEISTGP